MGALAGMAKPTVAAVNGVAAGAGAGLAFACDFRFVADTAGFNTSFVGVALTADSGVSWTLPRLVGHARATELLMKAGKKIVNVSDLREIGVLGPDVFAALSRMAQTDNAMIERAAYFTSPSSPASMQFYDLIRELKHPQRGVFQKLPDLEKWVAGSLTKEELARAHEFLNG